MADGADREPRGRSPGAEPPAEEYQKMVSLHRHILNLSTEGANLPLVPQLNNIISTVAAPGVDGRNPHEILEAIESLLREQRPALYTERPPRRAGRRRGGPEVEENLRPRQRRRREYARTQRAFRRNPREVALDILGEGGPQGDDAPPVRQFFDKFMMRFGTAVAPRPRQKRFPGEILGVIASLDPIAKREVIRALKAASKTAAGPLNPNLDIGALKCLGAEVLVRIYNVWLYLGVVLQWVKACRTTMILNKEPRNDVRNLEADYDWLPLPPPVL